MSGSTPTGAPPASSAQASNEPASPEPVRETPVTLTTQNAATVVTPPTHPGEQPVLVALDDRCDDAPPACAVDGDLASGYGWSLCVKSRAHCDANEPERRTTQIDSGAVSSALQQVESQHASDVAREHTIVAASREHAVALLRDGPGEARYTQALIVDPPEGTSITLAASLPYQRVAWIDTRRDAHSIEARTALSDELKNRGIAFAAITPHDVSTRARGEAITRALAWLRVGDDARVCPSENERATTQRVTVRCNDARVASRTTPSP